LEGGGGGGGERVVREKKKKNNELVLGLVRWWVALGNIIGWWCGGRWILRCGQDRTRGHTTELVGEETNVRSHHNTRTYYPRVTHLQLHTNVGFVEQCLSLVSRDRHA